MISFNYQIPFASLKNRTNLKEFIFLICKMENKKIGEINFVFCSDEYLLALNQRFLNHDTFTDIISFDYTEQEDLLNGEIYISIERVKENAKMLNTSFAQEIHRVIFHGVLHLCGYKDKLNEEKLTMRAKEDFYLREYFSQQQRST
jgi:rRNA maturation RNase YbeY